MWMRLFQIPEILTQSLIKPIRTDKSTPEGLARGRVFTGGNRGSCNSTRQMCNSPSGGGVLKYFFYEKEMVLKFGFTKIFQTVPCLFPPNNQLLVNEAHNRFLWESACVFFFLCSAQPLTEPRTYKCSQSLMFNLSSLMKIHKNLRHTRKYFPEVGTLSTL